MSTRIPGRMIDTPAGPSIPHVELEQYVVTLPVAADHGSGTV
jgi:hypothetical protein